MQKDLSNYRKSSQKSELLEDAISDNPMEVFQKWFHEVEATDGVDEPNAMTVSTIGLDGYPKSRVVLMKKFTFEGFIFYTNYLSEKGKALALNNREIYLLDSGGQYLEGTTDITRTVHFSEKDATPF